MHTHPPLKQGPARVPLPFGGLGLDLAEVRRVVSGLVLKPFPTREEPRREPVPTAPTPLFGAELLIMLCREPLGS